MTIIDVISDTEGYHDHLKLTGGDILIVAGDATKRGTTTEFIRFFKWFSSQNYTYKIFVAGNHDRGLDYRCDKVNEFDNEKTISEWRGNFVRGWLSDDINNIILISAVCTVEGLRIYGSPYTPEHVQVPESNAFTLERGKALKQVWNMVPRDLDILITHGPPQGILDYVPKVGHVGDEELLKAVKDSKPKIHLFGHVHEGRGLLHKNDTLFVNVSCLRNEVGRMPRSETRILFDKKENTIDLIQKSN